MNTAKEKDNKSSDMSKVERLQKKAEEIKSYANKKNISDKEKEYISMIANGITLLIKEDKEEDN